MSPGVCPEDVYGVPNFFSFLLMYVSDFSMILRYLDTLHAVCVEIQNKKIVIWTDSFCTANPYVLRFETQKFFPLFRKRGKILVEKDGSRYEPSLGLKMS